MVTIPPKRRVLDISCGSGCVRSMSEPTVFAPQPPPGAPFNPHLPEGIPRIVTIFGVLHLVFAGIGLLMTAWGLFDALAGNPLLKMQGAGASAEIQAQLAIAEKLKPTVIANSGLSILVGIVMIIAGIMLVKGRRNGLAWSNKYAYLSLVAKVANMVIALMVVVPATREMMGEVMKGTPMPAGSKAIFEASMIGGAIGGILVTCIYPILTLILLNQRGLREWFASRSY